MESFFQKVKNIFNKETDLRNKIPNKENETNNQTQNYIFETNLIDNIILEGVSGDKLEINDVIIQKLIEKGKKSTCKIILSGKGITKGSGFFCKIPYFGKTMKVLFTNNHILDKDSIKKGNEIKLSK